MALVYATLDDLILEVRQGASKSISFYQNVSNISIDSADSDFIFNHTLIVPSNDFTGSDDFYIEFTSTTAYRITHSRSGFFSDLFVGNGTISTAFTLTNVLTIPLSSFSGVITVGDKVKFTLSRTFSITTVLSILENAQEIVDDYAKSLRVVPLEDIEALLYGNTYADVPRAIRQATTKFAFAEMLEKKLFPVAMDGLGDGFTSALRNSARKLITANLEKMRTTGISANTLASKVNNSTDITATGIAKGYCDLRTSDTFKQFGE